MNTDLSGVFAKLNRAKRHLADLDGKINAVIGDDHQRLVFDYDAEANKHVVRVYGVPDIPDEWNAIVGDCLFNVRSALDHLAWQLVILDGKTPLPKDTQFPIRESPFNKKGDRVFTQLKPAVSNQDILDTLESVQPYMTLEGQPTANYRENLLWMLSTLNNIDKHRLLLVMLCVPAVNQFWWGRNQDDPSPEFHLNWASLKEGSPVAWFDFKGAEPPDYFEPHGALQVSLNETEAPRLSVEPVKNVLDTFIWWVEWHVLGMRFWPLFPQSKA